MMSDALEPANVINTLHDMKRYAELRDYCVVRLKIEPTEMIYLQNCALACLHLELYEEALQYCGMVLESDHTDTYALHNMIYALEKLHKYDEVLCRCQDMLAVYPRDIWTTNSAGLALSELGRHEEALKYFGRSLELDPHNITALMNAALCEERLDRTRQAISHYDAALRLDHTIRGAAQARSRAYHKLGMADEAFLAAQGIPDGDMDRIIRQAHHNRCSLLHQLCIEEMGRYHDVDPHKDNPFRPSDSR